MATSALTGKSFTFLHGSVSGTAQITTGTIDETGSTSTIQTLGGSVAISQGVEGTISAEFLYDGDVATGSFYAALKTALDSQATATVVISDGVNDWTASAIVSSLSTEFPADDAVTCSAEFAVSGSVAFADSTP